MSNVKQTKKSLSDQIHIVDDGSFKSKWLKRWKYQLRYASLRKRLFSFIIDFLLSSIFVSLVPMIITSIHTQEKSFTIDNLMELSLHWQIICCLIATLAGVYYFCMYPLHKDHIGQTPGKRLMKIKVVSKDEQDITLPIILKREIIGSLILEGETAFPSAFVRYLIFMMIPLQVTRILSIISIMLSISSIIWCVIGKDRRMFHDMIANTMVVDK